MVENPTDFPDDIHLKCPPGIIYVGDVPTEKDNLKMWLNQVRDNQVDRSTIEQEDLFRIGRFIVHVGAATITNLKKMRSYWPKE